MLEDSELGFRLIAILSWALIILGILKMILFLVGEYSPKVYDGIKKEAFRKFLTGKSNRMLFGWGGLITAILGGFFLGLGYLLRFFSDRML